MCSQRFIERLNLKLFSPAYGVDLTYLCKGLDSRFHCVDSMFWILNSRLQKWAYFPDFSEITDSYCCNRKTVQWVLHQNGTYWNKMRHLIWRRLEKECYSLSDRLQVSSISLNFVPERSICYSNPCMYGGTCLDEAYGYRCSCRAGYSGINCQREYWCFGFSWFSNCWKHGRIKTNGN